MVAHVSIAKGSFGMLVYSDKAAILSSDSEYSLKKPKKTYILILYYDFVIEPNLVGRTCIRRTASLRRLSTRWA